MGYRWSLSTAVVLLVDSVLGALVVGLGAGFA